MDGSGEWIEERDRMEKRISGWVGQATGWMDGQQDDA